MVCVILFYFLFNESFVFIFFGGTALFWFMVLLTAPFHIQYLIENWDTKLIVDGDGQTVSIEKNKQTVTYNVQDLRIERHLLGHHKPGREKSARPIPFDYYGYVKIKTKDKAVFYITSLMTDPFDFPLPIDETVYGFTFINKTELIISEKRKQVKFIKEQKIEEYIEKFNKLSDETLIEKMSNFKRYEIEAVEAAKCILNERQKTTAAARKI
jgi:hypothetical protein